MADVDGSSADVRHSNNTIGFVRIVGAARHHVHIPLKLDNNPGPIPQVVHDTKHEAREAEHQATNSDELSQGHLSADTSPAPPMSNGRAQRPEGEQGEPAVRWSAKFDAISRQHSPPSCVGGYLIGLTLLT